jgi:branched-subunit amino acid aminotransferase/4-amino-4-deoxychorismate lyase
MVTAEDAIVTPVRHILKGITRMKVLEVAGRRFRTEERDMTVEELKTAKEAFITSTTKHILPVLQIDDIIIGKASPGEGIPGDVSRWLNQELYALALN